MFSIFGIKKRLLEDSPKANRVWKTILGGPFNHTCLTTNFSKKLLQPKGITFSYFFFKHVPPNLDQNSLKNTFGDIFLPFPSRKIPTTPTDRRPRNGERRATESTERPRPLSIPSSPGPGPGRQVSGGLERQVRTSVWFFWGGKNTVLICFTNFIWSYLVLYDCLYMFFFLFFQCCKMAFMPCGHVFRGSFSLES